MFLRGRTMFAPTSKNPSTANIQNKKIFLPSSAFFPFAKSGAKREKATKKKTPRRSFALCGARRGLLVLVSNKPLKRLERNFNGLAKDLLQQKIIESKKAKRIQ